MNEKCLMRRQEMKAGFVISLKKDQHCLLQIKLNSEDVLYPFLAQ